MKFSLYILSLLFSSIIAKQEFLVEKSILQIDYIPSSDKCDIIEYLDDGIELWSCEDGISIDMVQQETGIMDVELNHEIEMENIIYDPIDYTDFDIDNNDNTTDIQIQSSKKKKNKNKNKKKKKKKPTPSPTRPPTIPSVWHLDSIFDDFTDNTRYEGKSRGKGITIYSIDTGVDASLTWEFGDRVQRGINFAIDRDTKYKDLGGDGGGNVDPDGHGTMTTSLAAGRIYGLAYESEIIPVRVVNTDRTASLATLYRGLNWVDKHKNSNKKLVQFSLGNFRSSIIDRKMSKMNAIITNSAGNRKIEACDYSPNNVDSVLTVGATEYVNKFSTSYSNWGTCVDILAPGTRVKSANPFYPYTRIGTGTSLSAPIVAGAVSIYWSSNLKLTKSDVRNAILFNGKQNNITNVPSTTPNLYVQVKEAPPSGCKIYLFKNTCVPKRNCKWFGNYGCVGPSFCDFNSKRLCKKRNRCKWKNNQCKPKN